MTNTDNNGKLLVTGDLEFHAFDIDFKIHYADASPAWIGILIGKFQDLMDSQGEMEAEDFMENFVEVKSDAQFASDKYKLVFADGDRWEIDEIDAYGDVITIYIRD